MIRLDHNCFHLPVRAGDDPRHDGYDRVCNFFAYCAELAWHGSSSSFRECRTSRPLSGNCGDYTKKWGERQGKTEDERTDDGLRPVGGKNGGQ